MGLLHEPDVLTLQHRVEAPIAELRTLCSQLIQLGSQSLPEGAASTQNRCI